MKCKYCGAKRTAATGVCDECLKAKLDAELGRLKEFSLKVSQLGGVQAEGLGQQYPVTLYPEQWDTLLKNAEVIRKFITDNAAAIKTASDGLNARVKNDRGDL